MATLSLLGYGLPQGLTLTKTTNNNMSSPNSTNSKEESNLSKTFSKITVQNVLNENNRNSINMNNNNSPGLNSSNAIVRKIKDFGMVGAVNSSGANTCNTTGSVSKSLLIRKRPLGDSKSNFNESNKPMTQQPKKPKQQKEQKELKDQEAPKATKKANNENVRRPKKTLNALSLGVNGPAPKPAGTPGRKGLPLPQAVARRNARERNRVKQVNNGFAALRERIPEEVAEAFEAPGTGRGSSAKKLSKVETLRMAVEYIRSLERLLGFDFSLGERSTMTQQYSGSSGDDSYSIVKDEFDVLSPSMDDNFEDSLSHYEMDDYFPAASTNNNVSQTDLLDTSLSSTNPVDLLPNITTLNGLQYIRIPGTNTYQLLTPDIFVGTTHSPPNSSLDDENFSALIDTNCLSPATAVGTTTSPTQTTGSSSINTATTTTTAIQTATSTSTATVFTAPASPNTATKTTTTANNSVFKNGEPVAVSLSRLSPVPQMLPATSSPGSESSTLYHQNPTTMAPQPATLSPVVNEHSSQACATDVQRQFVAPTLPSLQQHLIKQEYGEVLDFVSTTKSPNAITVNAYQTKQAAGNQSEHATHSMSPPLDRCNRFLIAPHHTSSIEMQSFYEQDENGSFYESNLSFKKDLDDVLLDASSATNTGLSDESMIEAIDWWEAHTPQSDGSGAVML